MAFIIKRQSKNKTLHYLVESVRVNGQSKHKTILTMKEHPTLDSLLASIEKKMEKVQNYKQFLEECHRHVESGLEPQRKEHTWSLEDLTRYIGYKEQNLASLRKEYEYIEELKERYFPKTSSGKF